jgi:hypothetical protein
LTKLQKFFFAQKAKDFSLLQTEESEKVKITISSKNILETEAEELFAADFFPGELKEKLNEEGNESSFFLTIIIKGEEEVVAQVNFAEFIFAAQFWKYPFSLYDYFVEFRKHLTSKIFNEEKDLFIGQFNFLFSAELTLKEIYDIVISDLKNSFQKTFDTLIANLKTNL